MFFKLHVFCDGKYKQHENRSAVSSYQYQTQQIMILITEAQQFPSWMHFVMKMYCSVQW